MSDPTTLQAGDVVARDTVHLTRADLLRYADASTDQNPIHQSDAAARAIGLPGVVAHGMLTMGVALRPVVAWAGGPERVLSYSVRFSRPVVVDADAGADLGVEVTVIEVVEAVATVAIEVTAAGEKVLTQARAEVDLG